jgi:CRISPR system Cascade subunit CasA
VTRRPSFDLATEPWISVLDHDGAQRQVGLRQALRDAHLIADLALPYPAAYGALYRVLAALVFRITGLDQPPFGEDWYRRRNKLFATPFSPDAIESYFTAHAEGFDLYGDRGFFQDPRLRTDCKKTSGINKLAFGRAAGSARPWFADKHGDDRQKPLASAEAAVHLLMQAYYGAGGTVTTRRHGNLNTQAGCPAAPLRGTVGFHPLGPDLRTTLLAHLTAPTAYAHGRPDRAPWEHAEHTDPTLPVPAPSGPVSLLVGRMRHAILLVPGPDASTAEDATISWGARTPADKPKPGYFVEPFPDPYLSYGYSKTGMPSTPVDADGGRHLFRDLDVLLNAPESRGPAAGPHPRTRPAVLHACDHLPDAVIDTLRLRVVGVDQDRSQTVDRQWWTSTTPPLLVHSAQRDPQTAELIEQAVREADTSAWKLNKALAAAFADRPKDRTAPKRREARVARHYWPRADTAFWRLFDGDDLSQAQAAMRRAALDAFDDITAGMARSLSAGRRVAEARALLPLPRKNTDDA